MPGFYPRILAVSAAGGKLLLSRPQANMRGLRSLKDSESSYEMF